MALANAPLPAEINHSLFCHFQNANHPCWTIPKGIRWDSFANGCRSPLERDWHCVRMCQDQRRRTRHRRQPCARGRGQSPQSSPSASFAMRTPRYSWPAPAPRRAGIGRRHRFHRQLGPRARLQRCSSTSWRPGHRGARRAATSVHGVPAPPLFSTRQSWTPRSPPRWSNSGARPADDREPRQRAPPLREDAVQVREGALPPGDLGQADAIDARR
jgi:hypothetical protein